MPKSTILEMPPEEQAQMLAALWRERYGYLLALHILLLCAVGRHSTEMADALFCSRSRVYRTVRAYRAGTLGLEPDEDGRLSRPLCTTVLVPMVPRVAALQGLWTFSYRRSENQLAHAMGQHLESEAEACFRSALDIARRPQAKSLELRAATSLSRLWQAQGRPEEARQSLAQVYGRVGEGFATADLREARALLDELASQPSPGFGKALPVTTA
jgi:hypothetical protein